MELILQVFMGYILLFFLTLTEHLIMYSPLPTKWDMQCIPISQTRLRISLTQDIESLLRKLLPLQMKCFLWSTCLRMQRTTRKEHIFLTIIWTASRELYSDRPCLLSLRRLLMKWLKLVSLLHTRTLQSFT